MSKLAINGGPPVRSGKWPVWPVVDHRETELMGEVVPTGNWSYNGPKETELRRLWAEFIGSKHAVPVANGTVSLQLCMEALDIGYGDEVIVPGLTWQATGGSVLDVNATPVFVDVEESSWCIDPAQIEEAITPRTKAIIAVHLYGTICNMDAINAIAKKHNLFVVEDAAHQHGSVYKGRKVGVLGDAASFSLQNSKVYTCGEGGLVTTNHDLIAEKLDALRNCGRRAVPKERFANDTGNYEMEGNFIQSGNYRITEFQAAILIGQLEKLPGQLEVRDRNAQYLNALLEKECGLKPMKREPGTDLQSYFNIAFRYDKECFAGIDVVKFRGALSAELNSPFTSCYQPLNHCELYSPLTKKRHKINREYMEAINPNRFELKQCAIAYKETSVCAHHKILLGSKDDMDKVVEAVSKIRENIHELR